jgi:hypothetical protein
MKETTIKNPILRDCVFAADALDNLASIMRFVTLAGADAQGATDEFLRGQAAIGALVEDALLELIHLVGPHHKLRTSDDRLAD